jgi:hypothetical protein
MRKGELEYTLGKRCSDEGYAECMWYKALACRGAVWFIQERQKGGLGVYVQCVRLIFMQTMVTCKRRAFQ